MELLSISGEAVEMPKPPSTSDLMKMGPFLETQPDTAAPPASRDSINRDIRHYDIHHPPHPENERTVGVAGLRFTVQETCQSVG